MFAHRYRIGVYAAGSRCSLLKERGLAELFWLPEAPAWDGTREFMNSGEWTFYQNKTDISKSDLVVGHGAIIDTDIVNPIPSSSGSLRFYSIGAFKKDGSEKQYSHDEIEAIGSRRFWAKAKKLSLRDAPDGNVVGHLCIARTVHVLEFDGDWAKVDIDEDGASEGFCHRNYLSPLNDMPRWEKGCAQMAI